MLVTPLAHENLNDPSLPDGTARNIDLKLYADAMKRVAAKHQVPVVDLFSASQRLIQAAGDKGLTINGVHLSEHGDAVIGAAMDEALFGAPAESSSKVDLARLKAEVNEKNLQFFYDYRAINGFYIYGGRKQPFGVVNFPAEFAKLRKMIAVRRSPDLGRRPREASIGKTRRFRHRRVHEDRNELQECRFPDVARRGRENL